MELLARSFRGVTCRCGDALVAHLHYRRGTECSCPDCRCPQFRRPPLLGPQRGPADSPELSGPCRGPALRS